MILRREAVVRIPQDVDPATAAPLLCAGVTVFNSIRQAKIPAGELVAIQGIGGLGHLAIQYASKMGYKVAAISSGSGKEKFAKELGASFYIDESKESAAEVLQNLGGAAGIVSTAPNPAVIGSMVSGLRPRGKLIILAGESIHKSLCIPFIN
jgi:D-arabinose 1-dehydrogenase-like Zn-dependent alcohol dehydrogenase